ncbi:RING/FYVE/PHD-type zinc finger family protein [Striga hermonthica]|uniref:RING/FYVE/PHD-type zinc finger family protein n=1 Tax=Striga hermonthica TaxID=68872 RepID=A0A9N7RRB2_STRHE|nr:RING/FYVE/PHD-type zinc finger family protein [Striga hermonthica]
MGPNDEAMKANGVAVSRETCSNESGGEGLLTYKRRKIAKVAENKKMSQDSVGQPSEKSTNYSHERAQFCQHGSHPTTALTDDCLLMHQRNVILEQISQSLDTEDSLRKCIQSAYVFHPGSGSRTRVEEPGQYIEDCSKCISQPGTLHGHQKAAGGYLDVKPKGSGDESKHCPFTELCQRTLSDIIMSETFSQLCSLLLENFQGWKTDNVFNFTRINSRMKENAYESSPMLFHSDIQEVWAKLQKVGSDITALAKCLSDKTLSSFHEQFPSQEPIPSTKSEQTDAHIPDGAHTCRRCRQQADDRSGLVCDSCEGMYHISCIEPPVKEIPTSNWYCADCTSKDDESPHENCVACERLNSTISFQSGDGNNKVNILHDGRITEDLDKRSNGFYTKCKVCMNEIRNEEEYKICGHPFCPDTFYHVKCLTGQQLVSHGACWYCPSCICRACLTDRDDDKIVLCDGCDHAYHIYCMVPSRDSVPKGKWFCVNCESGMARIQEAKRMYVSMQRMGGIDEKLKGKKVLHKSGGGVDMLLNAAKTLNYEENLASKGLKIG